MLPLNRSNRSPASSSICRVIQFLPVVLLLVTVLAFVVFEVEISIVNRIAPTIAVTAATTATTTASTPSADSAAFLLASEAVASPRQSFARCPTDRLPAMPVAKARALATQSWTKPDRWISSPDVVAGGATDFAVCEAPLPASVYAELRALRVFLPQVQPPFCIESQWTNDYGQQCTSLHADEPIDRDCRECKDAIFFSRAQCVKFENQSLAGIQWRAVKSFAWADDLPSPLQRLRWRGQPWPSRGPLVVMGRNVAVAGSAIDTDHERFSPKCMYHEGFYHHNTLHGFPPPSRVFADANPALNVSVHDVVVLLSQSFDDQLYHMHIDIVPRLLPYVQALMREPGKICLAFSRSPDFATYWHQLLQLIGADTNKFVYESLNQENANRYIYARRAYFPVNHAIGTPLMSSPELIWLRQVVYAALPPAPRARDAPFTVLMIRRILKRNDISRIDPIWVNIKARIPSANIVLFEDDNATLMGCLPCQIAHFQQADVVIGLNGAGMGGSLYVRPGTLVIVLDGFSDTMRSTFFVQLAMLAGARPVSVQLGADENDMAEMVANFHRER
jgi:hypothetical protein